MRVRGKGRSCRCFVTEPRFTINFDPKVFEPLKKAVPNFRDKIQFVEGDCEKKQIGLSELNKFLIIQHITIVFHCASNVEFDRDLRTEIKVNVFGAVEVIKLAKRIRKLKVGRLTLFFSPLKIAPKRLISVIVQVMVYVSSAYAHCHLPIVEEKPYTYSYNYRTLLKLIENDTRHVPDEQCVRINLFMLAITTRYYEYCAFVIAAF